MQRLPIEPIAQAAARQRAGRCGRLGPGVCVRLYSADDLLAREAYTTPEIQRSNLAAVMLTMADLSLGRVEDFPFLDPPRRSHVADGRRTLQELGRNEEARPLFERALELNPESASSLAGLGRLALDAGDHETAAEHLQAALELAQRYLYAAIARDGPLESPAAAGDFLLARMKALPHEVFACLYLDARHRVVAFRELFSGSIDSASVHPREIVRSCLEINAAAVILAHNHPSGVAEPSAADGAITRRVSDALGLIDVRVLDHLVVGESAVVSMAARGLL